MRRTGLPSIHKFFGKVTNIQRLVEKDTHHHKAADAYLAKAYRLPVVPTPLGVVSHKGINNELNLTNMSVGNWQAEALGKALEFTKAKKINLQNNRLDTHGALSIL